MKGLAAVGDGPLVAVVQTLCKTFKVWRRRRRLAVADAPQAQEADVCDGAIAREGPILAHALRQIKIGSKASHKLCVTLLGACAYPAVTAWDVPLGTPRPPRGRPRPSGKKPLQVVHYSDIHVDLHYTPGSSTDCKKPICCR